MMQNTITVQKRDLRMYMRSDIGGYLHARYAVRSGSNADIPFL